MGFLDWFRRPAAVADRDGLLNFLDTRAAYVVQKGIYDHVQAVAGRGFYKLMREQAFLDALETSRWRSYPLGLRVIIEMMHGVLEPTGRDPRLLEGLKQAAFAVFDRYPLPRTLDPGEWAKIRDELALRIDQIGLHPAKRVKDIPLPIVDQFFANLPIHERVLGTDKEIFTNNLRTNLIRIQEEFVRIADVGALVSVLTPAGGVRESGH